jgi:glycogen debranching enzyme
MEETLRLDESYSIIAESERPATPLRVLKQGESFGVFDQTGNIRPADAGEQGLYHDGTRFLSRFELVLCERRPLLLSSTISADNTVFVADLTNPDVRHDSHVEIPRGEIHLVRSRVLWNARCVERLRVSNYALRPIDVPIAIRFDADFRDVFEVRGTRRARRGDRLADDIGHDYVMQYRGLDGRERRARICWSRTPDELDAGRLLFVIPLKPLATEIVELTIGYEIDSVSIAAPHRSFEEVVAGARTRLAGHGKETCGVFTSNATFNRWLNRSMADLQMMMTDTDQGLYPYAGIPWFSAPFGRDGLITAFELLWAAPQVARGVLAFLAETQATGYSDAADMQPGKIVHEMRNGEMAALGEVPFGRYYGSADATPLFVMLAHAYYERTGDRDFIDRLWPNIAAALDWMVRSGDQDGDGFIEYARHSEDGLVQQGWKDSHDSVFHADGTLAQAPIAICEVQGYAFGAWLAASRMAGLRGDLKQAAEWRERADQLKARFNSTFWCEALNSYALALDGNKRRCEVLTSNPGHCLFAGIVSEHHAERVSSTLMGEALFAGWGVRTVAAGERRYNPMSYHNGSIWPHDNAVIAAGLAREGYTGAATRIMTAMFELSEAVDLHRLPELICGFQRRGDEHPTLYPVACAPQSWAAGAVYMLLSACLGLHIDTPSRRLSFTRAQLPRSVDWIQMTNLEVGSARVDIRLERHPHDVGVIVLRRDGHVEIVNIK